MSALYVLIIALHPTPPLLLAYGVFLLLLSVTNPALGVAAWCIIAPLFAYLGIKADMAVPLEALMTPPVIMGFVINGLMRRNRYLSKLKPFLLFQISFFVMVWVSMAVSHYYDYGHVALLLAGSMLISVCIASAVIEHRDSFKYIAFAVICSALIAMTATLIESDMTRRLRLGGNVRQMANIIGIALSMISAILMNRIMTRGGKFLSKETVVFLITMPLLFGGLVATMSKGVMLSLWIAVMIAGVYGYFSSRIKLRAFFIGSAVILFLGLGILIGYEYVANIFGSDGQVLWERLEKDQIEEGIFSRNEIWVTALGQMKSFQFIVGSGLGSFRSLAQAGGLDYYAHSLFVDAFFSAGAVGLFLLLGFMVRIGIRIIRKKNIVGICLLVFLISSYATHGTVTSIIFWMGVGLVYGLAYKPEPCGVTFRCAGIKPTIAGSMVLNNTDIVRK